MIYIFGSIWASHVIVSITLKFYLLNEQKVYYTIALAVEFCLLTFYFLNKIRRISQGKLELIFKVCIRIAILLMILSMNFNQIQSFLAGSYMQLLMKKTPIYLKIFDSLTCFFYFIMWGNSNESTIIGSLFSLLMLLNTCIKYYYKEKKKMQMPVQQQHLIKVKTSPVQSQNRSQDIQYISQPSHDQLMEDLQMDHYRKIFSSFPDGIIMLNKKKQVTLVNKKLQKMMSAINKREAFQRFAKMKNVQQQLAELENINQMLEEKRFIQQLSQDMEFESKSVKFNFEESRYDDASEYKSTFNQCNQQFETVNKMIEYVIDNQSTAQLIRMICQNNEQTLFEVSLKPFDQRQLNGYILIIVRDITSFNVISMYKKQISEKSNLLNHLAHEFRSPLNSIKLMVQQLQPSCSAENTEKYIFPILSQIECFMVMIQELLDMAVINAQQFKLKVRYFDLHKLISEVYQIMTVQAKAKNNQLLLQLDNVPDSLFNDPLKIRQILLNLLSNAMKFTSQGQIVISGRTISSNIIELTVSDTGLGIAEKNKQRLFAAFSKLEDPTEQNPQGIGLGLMISNVLASRLNETGIGLQVVSEEGKGSRFSFQLYNYKDDFERIDYEQERVIKQQKSLFQPLSNPIKQYESSRMSGLDISNFSKCQCPEVLLVDDEPFIIQTLQEQMKNHFKVELAYSGVECLNKVSNFQHNACGCKNYKIIVMDIEMPGMNGIQTTKRLIKEGFQGYIVGHTAYTGEQETRECLQAGMSICFPKPLNFPQMLQWLENK